jgi:hypothetical protein
MVRKNVVSPLVFDTYLALIRNSVGSKLFRNAFFLVNGKKQDILRNGNLSCAIYVSSILRLVNLISETHATVKGTVEAMRRAGWRQTNKLRIGSIVVWETETFKSGEAHGHIGFYIGNNKAVSNSSKGRSPVVHHWKFGLKRGKSEREIKAAYWNRKLDQRAIRQVQA